MRLHRLRLAAFGPFAAEQSVDFDELSAAGLFLLHGPTGGGKTSVLDAVCFALYGQVPGTRPATRLRSDHADPGTPTEVVLELTLAGRRLEITRRPEQPRAKKRGSGVTTEKAVTLLREQRDGQWRASSRSHQEIGEEIKQLVGMSCEQFCQVVLLPQGEFATFLRATATERAALLGRLFDTRRFRSVEHRLRDGKQDAAQRLVHGDREIARLAARMRQAAGDTGSGSDAEPGPPAEFLAHAAVLRCTAREQHDIARTALERAELTHAAAQAAATQAREVSALQQRHAEAVRRAAALAEQQPARTAARATLDRARRATTIDPALTHRDKLAARHAEALALEHEATSALLSAPDIVRGAILAPGTSGAVPPQAAGGSPERAAGDPASEHRGSGEVPATGDRVPGPAGGSGGSAVVPAAGRVPGQASGSRGASPGQAAGDAEGRRDPGGSAPGVSAQPESGGRPALKAAGPAVAQLAGGRAAGLGADELVRRAGELREVVGGLVSAGEVEARMAEVTARRERLEHEERSDEEAVRDADGWLAEWPRVRDGLQARLDSALEAAARAGDLAGELAQARQRRDAAAERDVLAQQLARAEQAARDARDRAGDAREAWQDLRESRIAGIAAELAAALTDGEPCRVCGSAAHPAPARPAEDRVTRADEDAAYAGFQRRSADHDAARDTVTRLRTGLDAATATAGENPQPELAAAHTAAQAAHDAAARAAATVPEARAALARAEEERDRRTAQQQDALHRTAARTSRREELDEQHERLSDELARARDGHPSVAARRGRLTAAIGLLDRAAHTVRERADSGLRLAEAETALAEAAARAGFGSAAEAVAALLPPPRLWEAERQLAAWAKEEAAAEADLCAPQPAAAAELPPADPVAAQAALDAANLRLRQASAAESAAATRSAELDRLGAKSTAVVRELAPARAAYDRIARLSDLASATSAENRYRMELETYVLAARLEQVAAAAGVRLQRMSSGRYTLVHSDARGGGRTKSGLGLRVVDAWTGTERDTATLSGGETFFASLALALGLADVVTDEAGGMRLDTLFIDEGFGSLDEQTLDEVLDVLDGLRDRDRAVGIVSHVADLRDRIPAQLQVTKGRDGSAVRQRSR
ncbi:AAA family ATPase [Streptomyces cocklensis]|uniref:Nuclease SbcCD subunit C n=1 Tax=Actinacidiphila cocklensis TaxID=887465 RepID=A0A9W4DW05_9ACTN|nr:AAA family ATPase [Actinacidiphila cocklensis]MDD1059775.1 AAA family ATPase [Actinacidiphila cocklensis]CAG6397050.1 Exonuclease SbcC [Actinacidiphila cocklensis]